MICNTDIRTEAEQAGVRLWQIAARLGCADATFSKKLRFELSADEKTRIKTIIAELGSVKAEGQERRDA